MKLIISILLIVVAEFTIIDLPFWRSMFASAVFYFAVTLYNEGIDEVMGWDKKVKRGDYER